MSFVLHCPKTGMYFCDEPYVVIRVRDEPPRPMVEGCAVSAACDATHYPTRERAERAAKKIGEYPEVLPA